MAVALYHEKQFGSLCGQHCLNNLLQGPYFGGAELAEIAEELDTAERQLLGTTTGESANVDDSGNFSIQVLSTAIKRSHDLSLVQDQRLLEDIMTKLNHNNIDYDIAFICHLHSHWFTIRRIYGDFWNLNSLLKSPEKISLFYLSAYIGQLREEGWSIFVVEGDLPEPMTDMAMGDRKDWFVIGVDADQATTSINETKTNSHDSDLIDSLAASLGDQEDEELKAALALSLQESKMAEEDSELEDPELAQALLMSMDSS